MTEDNISIYVLPALAVRTAQYEEPDAEKATPCWSFGFPRAANSSCLDISLSPFKPGFIHFTNGTTLYRVKIPDDGCADFKLVDSWTWNSSIVTEITMRSHRGIRWPAIYTYTDIGCLSYAPVQGTASRAMPKLVGEDLSRVAKMQMECGCGPAWTCFDEQSGRLVTPVRDIGTSSRLFRCCIKDFA